jgi:hypothetical protein
MHSQDVLGCQPTWSAVPAAADGQPVIDRLHLKRRQLLERPGAKGGSHVVAQQRGVAGDGAGAQAGADVGQPAVQVLVDGELGRVESEAVAAAGQRVSQGGLGLAAGQVAAQGLEGAGAVGGAGQLQPGYQRMQRPEHLPSALGWPLTHLRCRLPRLFIAVGWWGAGGGEQIQQGLLGDADTAADADRAKLAAGNRLVELVAPDPQDRGGLPGGEHLGQHGECAHG